jgi:simple sugar transport system ATP-binding protein
MNPVIPLIEMRGITKRFPAVVANDRIDLQVRAGEILALLGENSAGKTTLMKILYGLYRPDAGAIYVAGQCTTLRGPRDATRAGIGMVFQHFPLIPSLRVVENIALAAAQPHFLLRLTKIAAQLDALSARYRLPVDPQARVWQLSVGEQQRVEILKLLYRQARVLILDEPTAVLTPQEVEVLEKTLRQLAADGHAIILITHKLREVLRVAHRITVLRRGKVVVTVAAREITEDGLARLMMGRDTLPLRRRPVTEPGEVRLALTRLSAINDRGLPALKEVSLQIRCGEIVGIAGVAGNGQRELAEVIVGLRRPSGGQVCIAGEDVTNANPRAIINRGVSYIAEDRQEVGLALHASILDNVLLKSYRSAGLCWGPFLKRRAAQRQAEQQLAAMHLHVPGLDAPVSLLSGGNQQRLLLARELSGQPKVLIACQPTRGLDVGAVALVQNKLLAQRQQGCAILLISEDLDELLALSDRIAVICAGCIIAIVDRDEANRQAIGLLMAGEPPPRRNSAVETGS